MHDIPFGTTDWSSVPSIRWEGTSGLAYWRTVRCGGIRVRMVELPEAVDSTRTIDATVSRYAFSPERIEVRVGERIRLNVLSVDGTPGFQVKALGLNAGIPPGARSVTVELDGRRSV